MIYDEYIENELYKFHEVFEGYSPKAYRDCTGKLTIGVGHANQTTGTFDELSHWSPEKIKAVWRRDIAQAVTWSRNWLPPDVPANLMIAVIDLVFNTGKRPATLVEKAARHNYKDALCEILRWTRAGGIPRLGLIRRRIAMYALAMGYDWKDIAKCPVSSSSLTQFNSTIAKLSLKVEQTDGGFVIRNLNIPDKS